MNDALRELIHRYFETPDKIPDRAKATMRIKELQATEVDFSDQLFDGFTAEARMQIYGWLPLWTGRTISQKILERRANSETDPLCEKRLQFMLECLNKPPVLVAMESDPANDSLRELIHRYLKVPDQIDITMRIRELEATEADFSEALFDEFAAKARMQIYVSLALWTSRTISQKILERRGNFEVDRLCIRTLHLVLESLKKRR